MNCTEIERLKGKRNLNKEAARKALSLFLNIHKHIYSRGHVVQQVSKFESTVSCWSLGIDGARVRQGPISACTAAQRDW